MKGPEAARNKRPKKKVKKEQSKYEALNKIIPTIIQLKESRYPNKTILKYFKISQPKS